MSEITKIWIDEYYNNEYNSKRNLRPKREFRGYQIRTINTDRLTDIVCCRLKPTKYERYFMRSVYGSKY